MFCLQVVKVQKNYSWVLFQKTVTSFQNAANALGQLKVLIVYHNYRLEANWAIVRSEISRYLPAGRHGARNDRECRNDKDNTRNDKDYARNDNELFILSRGCLIMVK